MMPVKEHLEQMGSVERELLGSAPLSDLQAHFNNPDNKRRFEEWLKKEESNDTRSVKSQAGVRGIPAAKDRPAKKAKAG